MNLSVIILLALMPMLASAQPDISFRGLKLGASRADLQRLIETTLWSRIDGSGTITSYAILGADDHGSEGIPSPAFDLLGCQAPDSILEHLQCFHFDRVVVHLFGGKVYEFSIVGPRYPIDSLEQIDGYYGAAFGSTHYQFGRPVPGRDHDPLDGRFMRALGIDSVRTLENWSWKDAANSETASIELQIIRPSGDDVYIVIRFRDVVAYRAMRTRLDEEQR